MPDFPPLHVSMGHLNSNCTGETSFVAGALQKGQIIGSSILASISSSPQFGHFMS